MFFATVGYEAIKNVSIMAYPRYLEELTFKKNWRGNKKKYQTKEKVSHCLKNKISGNTTEPQ